MDGNSQGESIKPKGVSPRQLIDILVISQSPLTTVG